MDYQNQYSSVYRRINNSFYTLNLGGLYELDLNCSNKCDFEWKELSTKLIMRRNVSMLCANNINKMFIVGGQNIDFDSPFTDIEMYSMDNGNIKEIIHIPGKQCYENQSIYMKIKKQIIIPFGNIDILDLNKLKWLSCHVNKHINEGLNKFIWNENDSSD
eukprot:355420_1